MSERNPILDGYVMGEAMTDHNGVVCYPAMLQNSEDKYIVKKISVPATDVSVDALLLSGAYASKEEALAYYQNLANEILQEAKILTELSKLEGFVPYLASQVSAQEDGNGYAVSLIAPYRMSLEQLLSEKVMTHQGIMDLAMDICTALAACRRAGYLYIDLKPGNIFYTENNDYRIGDLGFISLASLRFASLQEKHHSIYTAPEIEDAMSQLNTTLDVYALGMILYQAYNGGHLPMDGDQLANPLLPPVYADYEMAEIILTACHPDVSRRWADPTQLGQALVQYMQRNGVSEDPIIPPPVTTPELDVGEEFLPEDELSDMDEDWDSIDDLSILEELEQDSPQPPEDGDQMEAIDEILAQADDLIAHVPPAPAVAPEPVDVPMPAPIVLGPKAEAESDEPESVPEDIPEEAAVQEAQAAEWTPDPVPLSVEEEDSPAPEAEAETSETEEAQEETEEPVKEKIAHPKRKVILRLVLTVLILGLLAAAAFTLYKNYQNDNTKVVHSLNITGTADSITVHIRADLEDSQLRVTCSDAYGNTLTSEVANGTATFTGLSPQTRYTIRVTTTGDYKLAGSVSNTFTTASQTTVADFTASIGPADGSVYLQFRVIGVECDQWILTWTADGVEPQSTTFAGHSCTVYDLQIGSKYTFTLSAGDDSNVVGLTQVTYVAQPIIRAENPVITACGNGLLTVTWDVPAGATVDTWTVRCYDESGFDQTMTIQDCTATFEGLTHETDCTIEITAEGMTQSVITSICANPINITDYLFETDSTGNLIFQWNYTGVTPEGGWSVSWSCDGTPAQFLEAQETAVLLPYIPGGEYTISLIPADGTPIFGHTCVITAPEAENFASYGIQMEDLQFMMCATPGTEDWVWDEIHQDAYKTTFSTGEPAGFVVWCDAEMENSEEAISITFLLRDETGNLIDFSATETMWNALWVQGFCELNIPTMPNVPGNYCLWIYFDGMFAGSQEFIVE